MLYRNKEWLNNQYTNLNKSAYQISNEFNYSIPVIYKWLKIHHINIRKIGSHMIGKKPHNFIGKHKSGNYIGLYVKNNPNADKFGRILEHRYVMSQYLGRPLKKNEIVHHINENTHDNRIKNLQIIDSPGKHLRDLHHHVPVYPLPKWAWGRSNNKTLYKQCLKCNTTNYRHSGNGYCAKCYYLVNRDHIMQTTKKNYYKRKLQRIIN